MVEGDTRRDSEKVGDEQTSQKVQGEVRSTSKCSLIEQCHSRSLFSR